MKKGKNIIAVSAFTVLLIGMSACSHSSDPDTSTKSQSKTDKTTQSSDNTAPSKDSTNTSDSSTGDTANNSPSSTSKTDNSESKLDQRTGAVLNATLKYESQQPDTTVDYPSYTMTQSGKKVRLTLDPAENHQDDFKEGLVKEVVNNGDESHDVTLFQWKIDDNNTLSLIDTSTEKVVYTTKITDTEKLGSSHPTGAWVKTFEDKLYKDYHVTPRRYKYIGNGNWEVWVKENDTGKNPYVTVNQNTGDFHG